MPRLSIIIPAVGDTGSLEQTLGSVLRYRPVDCEVLVTHGGDYNDPYQLGDEVRFVVADGCSGLLELMNVGLQAASGSIVHFLRGGCEVSENWCQAAIESLATPRVAVVVPALSCESTGSTVFRGWTYRPRGARQAFNGEAGLAESTADQHIAKRSIVAPMTRASFFDASELLAMGGFDESLSPEWAMIDAALRVERQGKRVSCASTSRIVSDVSPANDDTSSFRLARDAERVYWRHAGEGSRIASFAAHGLHVIGDALRSIVMGRAPLVVLGRATAVFMAPFDRGREPRSDAAGREPKTELSDPETTPSRPQLWQGEDGQPASTAQSPDAIRPWRADVPHHSRAARPVRPVASR